MNLDKFNDYLIDKIFESIKSDEIFLLLSERLYSYISSVNHPISKEIANVHGRWGGKKFKVSLLDIVDKNDKDGNKLLDVISFTQSNKIIEMIAKDLNITLERGQDLSEYNYDRIAEILQYRHNDYFNKSRSETTLGKIVNKLFPNQFPASGNPGQDIESFVNAFKAIRSFTPTFELVSGNDVKYWYNEKNYGYPKQGPLYGSCMRYSSCSGYLEFYSDNSDKVSLLILKDPTDDTKIIGRAIVWKINKLDGEDLEEPRFFMDRIYYTNEYIIDIFKNHAKENGWLYKFKQNMNEDETFIDSVNGEEHTNMVVDGLSDPGVGHYPYMDTMKYFDHGNGVISNDTDFVDDYYTFTDTDGGAEGAGGHWSDFYDDYIDIDSDYVFYCEYGDDYRYEDDCFYSDYYNATIANDYADRNGTFCDYSEDGDNWREDGDYEESSKGNTATKEYAQENWYWSDYSNEWEEDAVYSEYHETYIAENDAVEVYTTVNQSETDWRADDDDTWFEWEYDGEKYDNEISEDDLREENGLDEEEEDEEEEVKPKKKRRKLNK